MKTRGGYRRSHFPMRGSCETPEFRSKTMSDFVVPANAGTHNHQCLWRQKCGPSVAPHGHSWLWVPDRARCARLSGTTEIDSIFKQPILRPSLRGVQATTQSILSLRALRGEMDCFASLAMTWRHMSSFSRPDFARVFQSCCPSPNRGRRESRVANAPAASRAKQKSTRA